MWLVGEAFRVARRAHGELGLSFLILEHDEDDILHPSCQTGPILVWMAPCSYPVQQPSPGAAAHVGFEDLSHSRRRVHEESTGRVILNQASRMGILVPILLPHVFNQNDKMGHRHKMRLASFN